MWLCGVLDQLFDQVLVWETDAVWFIDRYGGAAIETVLDGDYIVDFVGNSPKSCSYLTFKGKLVTNIKGFSLNYENSQYLYK